MEEFVVLPNGTLEGEMVPLTQIGTVAPGLSHFQIGKFRIYANPEWWVRTNLGWKQLSDPTISNHWIEIAVSNSNLPSEVSGSPGSWHAPIQQMTRIEYVKGLSSAIGAAPLSVGTLAPTQWSASEPTTPCFCHLSPNCSGSDSISYMLARI